MTQKSEQKLSCLYPIGVSTSVVISSNIHYVVQPLSSTLLEYNSLTNSLRSYNLQTYIPDPFLYTTLCVLSPTDILLAGGLTSSSSLSTVYLFKSKAQLCIKLASLSQARHAISMIKHGKYVYAFGGRNGHLLKTSERYDTQLNRWEVLEDMMSARCLGNCVIVNENVYIIGGGSCSIEKFNINTLSFSFVYFSLGSSCVISAVYDDKIYLLSEEWFLEFSRDFKLLNSRASICGRIYSSPVNLYQLKSYIFSLQCLDFHIDKLIRVSKNK